MKILVTGSSGNIGSKIAELVSRTGICLGVDLVPGRYTTHLGSITDRRFIARIIPGVDAVIHAAAYLTPHVGVVSDEQFQHVNVHGTEVLLDLAVQHGIKRFVFTSTTSVFGCSTRQKSEALWVTEDLPPNPEDIYDRTKLEAERLCRQASRSGLTAVILRMSRCFPEPDPLQVFYRLYRGVSGKDVAMAHWLAAAEPLSGEETFIISAHSPFTRTDLQVLLVDPWSVIDRLYPQARKMYDQMKWERPSSIDRVYVIEKARQQLGYQPKENFLEFLHSRVSLPK